MSFDFYYWNKTNINLDFLVSEFQFDISPGLFTFSKKNWQISFYQGEEKDPEDISENITKISPDLLFSVEITIEPSSAPRKAFVILNEIIVRLLRHHGGLFEDPQNGTLTLHDFSTVQIPRPQKEPPIRCEMNFWFEERTGWSKEKLVDLFSIMKNCFPDILPVSGEKWKLSNAKTKFKNIEELAHFLSDIDESYVLNHAKNNPWYLNLNYPPKSQRPNFLRFGQMEISTTAFNLNDARDIEKFKNLFIEISSFIGSFYSDIRMTQMHHNAHPVKSWFWCGIPQTPPIGIALGEPLLSVCPRFLELSTEYGSINWMISADFGKPIDNYGEIIPAGIGQQANCYGTNIILYPEIWPFSSPYERDSSSV